MMQAVDIITKKRDGGFLTSEEIEWFVNAYVAGDVPDYQAAAFLMAVYLRGMTREETTQLTLAMVRSGEQLDLSDILGYVVDKHSSGGVGDKTTLVVIPLVAACGVPVAKMSGRGLGYSGGTIDKLESISGFNVNLSADQFRQQAREQGIVLAGQSVNLAPADGKFYALRDVTATVPSLPLIASSIMSKKIAAGAQGIVLDVKVGSGAFMTTLDDARALAQMMVDIGSDAGRQVTAVLSNMSQPLGYAVGNAVEVAEAIATLKGGGLLDFRDHCLQIAAYMLKLAGKGEKWDSVDENQALLAERLDNGQAVDKFRQLIAAQGGDVRVIDDFLLLPTAAIIETIVAERDGYIAEVNALDIGVAAFNLGAGRQKKTDTIDLAVGLKVHVKVGDQVKAGDPLATIHANNPDTLPGCLASLKAAFKFSDVAVEPLPLILEVIEGR